MSPTLAPPTETNTPTLSHEEQQKAVERIQEMMIQGISTAQAIKIVAEQIREEMSNKGE